MELCQSLAKGHIHRSLGQRPRIPLIMHRRLNAYFNHPDRWTGEVDFQPTSYAATNPRALP